YLPWQKGEGRRPYRPEVLPEDMAIAMKNIKIVHEDISDRDEDFNRARELLGQAHRIYFLGFGYARVNLERIGFLGLRHKETRGSGLGMTRTEAINVQTMCEGTGLTVHADLDCIGLLRNIVAWN